LVVRPSGTVTFLFTDIEGSTRRWESDPEAMRSALAAHDEILRDAVEDHRGWVFKHTGDGVCAAFASARAAVGAAIDAQRALALPVRMGVATGDATPSGDDYFGVVLNRVARLMDAAHGGQILVAASTASLLDDVELVDLGAHRLRDLSSPQRLFQVGADGLRRDFPALRTMDSVPGNLPVQLSSFVGRDSDVAAVVKLLQGHRLVTLTGVGGVGKTRMAMQIAAEMLSEFPDGVWFVDLAPVADPGAVGFAAAATLGVVQQPGLSAPASVADALIGRHLLVIVDNCEHVLDAAAELVELIERRAATVTVMATSREGLGVPGEQAWPVPSLATGAESAAVRLFVERAGEVIPGYEPGGEADAVVELCERLDGIPLAIELAAARLRSMSATQIRDRLSERFRLLTGGSRRGLRRHQTLQQTVQWSYDLLDEPESTVLCRAAVFAGGFNLAAADAVCGGGAVDAVAVLDALDSLARKSLINVERGAAEVRYRLLETIREFAEQQLAARSGLADARDRHAAHFAAEADHYGDVFASADQHQAYRWFDAEQANLRSAFRWSLDIEQLEQAARILLTAQWCGVMGANSFETIGWAEEILGPAADVGLRCLPSLYACAAACMQVGRVDESIGYGAKAVALGDDPRFDPDPFLWDYMSFGSAHAYRGDVERAIELWRSVVDRPEDRRLLFIRTLLPWMLAVGGHEVEACGEADATLAAADACGVPSAIVIALHAYGRAYLDRDPERAIAAKQRGLRLARDTGNRAFEHAIAVELAELEARHGDLDHALALLGEMLEKLVQAGARVNADVAFGWLALVFSRLGASDTAATIYGIAAECLTSIPFVKGLDDTLDRLRQDLGLSRFDECVQVGRAMDRRQALEYAYQQIQIARDRLSGTENAPAGPGDEVADVTP
jgi:predicted ATPase